MTAGFIAAAISRQDGSSADGIHLLWNAPPQIGYSINGFDIQRREAQQRNVTCYSLTAAQINFLHEWFRVNVPPGLVAFRHTTCPSFPPEPPDEPFHEHEETEHAERCTDFRHQPKGIALNPRQEKTGSYLVRNANGQPAAQTTIERSGIHTGMDCGRTLEIDLTDTANTVEITIVHFAQPATIEARRTDNSVAAKSVMSQRAGQPETVVLKGDGIRRVVIVAPQGEVLLLQLCFTFEFRAQRTCVDFRNESPGVGRNPREHQGIPFSVIENRKPAPRSIVATIKNQTGLVCTPALEIRLPIAVRNVELTIIFKQPPRITGRNEDGTIVDAPVRNAVAGEPHFVKLSGPALRAVSISGGEEVLLQLFCVESSTKSNRLTRNANRDQPSRFRLPLFDLQQAQLSASAASQTSCVVYDIKLSQPPHYIVRITAGLPAMLAIAMNEGKAVGTQFLSEAGGQQTASFKNRLVDRVLLYTAFRATSLTICVDEEDAEREEHSWSTASFIAKNVHLPISNVNSALSSTAAERALASSRLVPGEVFDPARFDQVAKLMNDTSAEIADVSPTTQVLLVRESQKDPFIEIRGWPYAFALLIEAEWRRMLGFAFLDKGGGLTPGKVYDYRITGRFRRRDLFEQLLGFHTIPLGTTLPRWFHLGPVRVETELPSEVIMFPEAPPTVLRASGRKGILLQPGKSGNSSLQLFFAEPVTRMVLELEPGESFGLQYEANTSDFLLGLGGKIYSGPIPIALRSEVEFPEPVHHVKLIGKGLLYGIRVPTEPPAGKPNEVLTVSVNILGVGYEPTSPPDPPPFLGTTNLQQPQLTGDPKITTQQPPQYLGFHLFWLPPPASGTTVTPWPTDLPAFPPFDVTSFHIERRRVDTAGPFVDIDESHPRTRFFGNRSSRRDPPHLYPGIDLLSVFPEKVKPKEPISPLMDIEDTLLSLAKPDGPPPGSFHQYRIYSIDAIGRLSVSPTVGSIVRLEKRVPPPQPVGPTTPAPAGIQRPVGVTARVLQVLDPRITPADKSLLGASQNAIVLDWAWTQAERNRDPFAKEFRVYFRQLPPDVVHGSLTGSAALSGKLWKMSASLNQSIRADAIKGQYLHTGSGSFKVDSNTAGKNITIKFELSEIAPAIAPLAAQIEFVLPPDADELRPPKWPERTAVVPITNKENYQFVFRDRLTITATNANVRVWVGVSAADDQSYIPDEKPAAQLNGGRPGNESSLVAVPANARYLGRPVFVVPPPLPDVPEQVTNEPVNNGVSVSLDLPGLLPTVVIPAGFKVKLERLSADALLNRISDKDDHHVGARLPDGTTADYKLDNPDDREAFRKQIRTGEGVRVEGRFIMDFLTRYLTELETLWQASAITAPVPFATVVDTLPGKSERYVHRIRLVDQAGHVSAGDAILPQFVRVPTLASPGTPAFEVSSSNTDTLSLVARVPNVFDLKWLVLFTLVAEATAPADEASLVKPQLLRLPNRRDLYPNDGIRLRLANGTILAPALAIDVNSGTLEVPDRVLNVPITAGFGKRVSVWAVAMTRDGITSRLAGPRTAFTRAAPLNVPLLNVTVAADRDRATWGAVSPDAEVSVERSTDAGASWTRVTPWLRPTQSFFSVPSLSVPRIYRLQLRASEGRTATGPGVIPAV